MPVPYRARPRAIGLTALLAGALLLGACGGDDDEAEAPKPVTGTFVAGGKEKTSVFVAVVAAPAKAGREKRDVRVYACDGIRVAEWFPGSAGGNEVELPSDDGDARVKLRLTASSATGTVELPSGKSVSFTAKPAAGSAGLYDATILPGGRIRGTSAAGGRLEASQRRIEGGATLSIRTTSADGTRRSHRFRFKEFDAAKSDGPFRLILEPDGSFKGARKGVPTGDGGGGDFTTRETDS